MIYRYEKFIKNRENRQIPINEKTHKHHILPRCQGGSDDENNLIVLTLREHCRKV